MIAIIKKPNLPFLVVDVHVSFALLAYVIGGGTPCKVMRKIIGNGMEYYIPKGCTLADTPAIFTTRKDIGDGKGKYFVSLTDEQIAHVKDFLAKNN